MYCRFCGKSNADSNFYCMECGLKTQQVHELESIVQVDETKTPFCKKCGEKTSERYCTQCGFKITTQTLESAKSGLSITGSYSLDNLNTEAVKEQFGKLKKLSLDDLKRISTNQLDFKGALKSAAIALSVSFVVCFILMFAVSQSDTLKPIYNEISSYSNTPGVSIRILPNGLDFLGLALQTPFSLQGNGSLYGGSDTYMALRFHMQLLVLLLIPLLGVFLGSYRRFKDDRDTKSHLLHYFATSIIYTFTVHLALMFNQKRIVFNDQGDFGLKIIGRFNLTSGIIITFSLIFIMHILFSIFMKRDVFNTSIAKQSIFNESIMALKSYLKNYALYIGFFILTFLGVLMAEGIGDSETGLVVVLGLLPNLFTNLWTFIPGNELMLSASDTGAIKLSLGKLWTTISGVADYGFIEPSSSMLIYIFLVLVFVGVLGIFLEAISQITTDHFLRKVGLFSVSSIVFNIAIAMLCAQSVEIIGDSTILSYLPYMNLSEPPSFSMIYAYSAVALNTLLIIGVSTALVYGFRTQAIKSKLDQIPLFSQTNMSHIKIIKLFYLIAIFIVMVIIRENLFGLLEGAMNNYI